MLYSNIKVYKKILSPEEYIVLRYHRGYQDLGYFFVLRNIHIQGSVFATRAANAATRTAGAGSAAGAARDAGATGHWPLAPAALGQHYRHQRL